MRHKLLSIIGKQNGFTMIEMLIAIAIASAIGGGILLSIYQTSSYQAMDKARMTCVKNLENAIHYVVQDAQMAQSIEPDVNADGLPFPLEMRWTEWDINSPEYEHTVTYSLTGDELKREHLANDAAGAETANDVNVLARYIDSDTTKTNCSYTEGVLSVTLTATITGFPKEISETRDMEIIPRPDW